MADEYMLNAGAEDDALNSLGLVMEKYGYK